MTEDQHKKYEEAAKEYALEDWRKDHTVNVPEATKYFLAGCTFASQDTDALLKAADILAREFRKCKDENKRLREALVKIENMSRYDTNHDNMLYAVKDINTLARKLLNL